MKQQHVLIYCAFVALVAGLEIVFSRPLRLDTNEILLSSPILALAATFFWFQFKR
jgi:hypothetical protein